MRGFESVVWDAMGEHNVPLCCVLAWVGSPACTELAGRDAAWRGVLDVFHYVCMCVW